MPPDPLQKPTTPSPILDRFHQELDNADDDVMVRMEDVVRCYEDVLSELTFNSKPIITDLTILAGEHRDFAQGIANSICARVLEVPVEQKLPSLYLLDSIVKNIGRDYVRFFASRLPEVFCETYKQVPPNLHPSMRHLFGTWSAVFPLAVLGRIEDELQFSPRANQPSSSLASGRASESPRPSHGIHVNPKYLEARRQFDNISVKNNIQAPRGVSSLKPLSQKHSVGYEDYDYDQGEGSDAQRFNSAGYGGNSSFPLSVDKMFPSGSGSGRPLSPSVDEFAVSSSPGRLFERASPSHQDYNYGRKVRGRDVEIVDWQKRQCSDDFYRNRENIGKHGLSNGFDHDRPRALIDAYGHDDGQRPLDEKLMGMDRQILNGSASKVTDNSWQNTEEEEFDWEDMSPTLSDWKSSNLTQDSVMQSRGSRPGLDPLARPFDPVSRRKNWATSGQISRLEDSQKAADGASQNQDGVWNLPGSLGAPIRNLPVSGRENASQLNLAANGAPVSSSDGKHLQPSGLKSFDARAPSPARAPVSTGVWPPTHSRSMAPLPPLFNPQQRQPSPSFDYMNSSYRVLSQGPQQLDNDHTRNPISLNPAQRQPGFVPTHHPSRPPVSLPQQLLRPQEYRQNGTSTVTPPPPPPTNLGYTPLGPGIAANNIRNNPMSAFNFSPAFPNVSNGSMQFQAPMPPLPPGPRPYSQFQPPSGPHTSQPPNVAISGLLNSGLLNSLVAQGLFPVMKQASEQDSLGEEFDPDLLKVRHESAIKPLYEDLPRQCTTCGHRFKTQEEHSKHMDWHVTKNRMSKNRKHNPSRRWFVSASMWLSGAEALGTDSAPGFLPTETAVEKKDDEEMAVPADEDQTACALCGESFEDFYSDDTEEWMYRGAVYLNTPNNGSILGMDSSQLGPIVHAKCRSESSTAPS